MRRVSVVVVLVALLLSFLASCGVSGCYENRTSIPKVALYAYNSPTQAVAIDSITVYGIGHPTDMLLLDCAKKVSSFAIPFRSDADTTSFVIHYDAKVVDSDVYNDTLTFVYNRYPYFISADCGVTYNYQILSFTHTHNMIDSAALVVGEVTNRDEETVRLYYYVAQ